VFSTNAVLREAKDKPKPPSKNKLKAVMQAWPTFAAQPSGVPLLVLSYALLYFTVLSPHGVIFTAYLKTRGLAGNTLAIFRAAGALSGVAGMSAFRYGASRLGVRRVCLVQLWILGVAVALASAIYLAEPMEGRGLTLPMGIFLGMIVISRFGLYGFDVGLLQLEQMHVDEKHRGEVGAVESSLCTLGTGAIYIATLATPSGPDAFSWIVVASALFVASGALCYTAWYCFYHEHTHTHGPTATSGDEARAHHAHGLHGEHSTHSHTTQQKRLLEEGNGEHTHLRKHAMRPWPMPYRYVLPLLRDPFSPRQIFIRHSPFIRTRVLEAELMEEFSSLAYARPSRWLGLLLAFMTWRMPYSAFACKWVNDK